MYILSTQHFLCRLASAGGGGVRGAVAVCLRRRGDVRGPRAGRLTRAFGAGKSGRVAAGKHFFACTTAALPIPAEKAGGLFALLVIVGVVDPLHEGLAIVYLVRECAR